MSKERLTVSVDRELARAATAAVAAGRAQSVSGWVSQAMTEKLQRERRLEALAEAVAAYEGEHGTIEDAELVEQARADRDLASAGRIAAKKSIAS